MNPSAVESLGWAATAVFVGSYFCARPEHLKRVQMVGAAMWAAYGMAIGSVPVIAANLLVLAAAAWTSLNRGASPLGLPDTLARSPLRRLAPFAWLASLRSLASRNSGRVMR
jgi:hypothetical protein